jgi:purine-cytosine permease-like protein
MTLGDQQAADRRLPVDGDADSPVDAVGRIEMRGAEYNPEEDRDSTPRELGIVFFGAQMCFGIMVLGTLPILFGLSWWSAFWAITIGAVLGTVFFGLMAPIGPRTGTNSSVSCGAFFGIRGRSVGSLIVLFLAIGFYSITVWTGGEAIVAGCHRLFGTPTGGGELAIAYAAIAVITVVLALIGHATIVAISNIVAPLLAALLLVGVVIFLGKFDSHYAGAELLLGGFWPTWLLAVASSAAVPLSYGLWVNDYARYLPSQKARAGAWAASIGNFLGCWFAMVVAAYFTVMFTDPALDFVFGTVDISPTWYVIPLIAVGLVGAGGQGAIALYGGALDASSFSPKFNRVYATIAVAAVGLALVYLGSLVWIAINLVSAFLTLLIIVEAPWLVISIIGHFANRGRYVPGDLQILNSGELGGVYWYTRGWNFYALGAWGCAVVVGLLFTNTPPLLEGPLNQFVGGVDISLPVASGLAAILYYGALKLRRRDVLPDFR